MSSFSTVVDQQITEWNKKESYLAPYSLLLVFLFYEAKIKPELDTFEKQVLIVNWQETNFFVHYDRKI